MFNIHIYIYIYVYQYIIIYIYIFIYIHMNKKLNLFILYVSAIKIEGLTMTDVSKEYGPSDGFSWKVESSSMLGS